MNVSVYAGDAVRRELPLLGGQDSIHDWNYLLDTLSWLKWTVAIAGAIRLFATLLIIAAIVFAFRTAASEGE